MRKLRRPWFVRPSMLPPHEPGTVAYHQHNVRWWRATRFQFAAMAVFIGAWMTIVELETLRGVALFVVPLFCVALFMSARGFERANSTLLTHRQHAWEVETQTTMQAMLESGLYSSPLEVMKGLRDGPVAPGFKRGEWLKLHDEAIADFCQEHPQFRDDQ